MKFRTLCKWIGVELVEVSATEKLIAALGGTLAIFSLVFLSFFFLHQPAATAVVASMGASAVLLFAVPHGQLSQPWPVIAGHGFSAIIGVACARWIPHQAWAAALAVGLAIGVMHFLKCIHPPGGATAFTAVMGGQSVHDLGFHFVWCPVLLNAVAMVLLAMLINAAFRWRRYPAVLNRPSIQPRPWTAQAEPASPTHGEILTALRSFDSFVDISEEDLIRLTKLLVPTMADRK